MLVEQAIFTSVRAAQREGYQVAAASSGVTAEEKKELSQWGPAHDSILPEWAKEGSINYCVLDSGRACVSCTTASGAEYSGRGGLRVYTQNLIMPPDGLLKFSCDPLRLIDAARMGGHLEVHRHPPEVLSPIRLLGTASLISQPQLERLITSPGPTKLGVLINAVQRHSVLGLVIDNRPTRIIGGLLNLIPLHCRRQFSFSSGLNPSLRRPFRINLLPSDPLEQRRSMRKVEMAKLDMNAESPAELLPRTGWAKLVVDLLREKNLLQLQGLLKDAFKNEIPWELLDDYADSYASLASEVK